jgi:hypothetical protein
MTWLAAVYVVAVAVVCTLLALVFVAVLRVWRWVTVDVPAFIGTSLARRRRPVPSPGAAAGDPRDRQAADVIRAAAPEAYRFGPLDLTDARRQLVNEALRRVVANDLAHLDREGGT